MKQKITLLIVILTISMTTTAQVSNTRKSFSCEDQVTVLYDLVTGSPANVTLYYSTNKSDWYPAQTVTGALTAQSTGTDKKIVWDCYADGIRFAKVYVKVEISAKVCLGVMIADICWAKTNLDVGGVFAANETDFGALYQWGRQTDGHEDPSSLCFTTPVVTAPCGTMANTRISNLLNGQPSPTSGAIGFFIRSQSGVGMDVDWRNPSDDTLWNSGDETSPVKTAADPCPDGWRVPTGTELRKLLDTANVTITDYLNYNGSGIKGSLVTDNATSASMFLPATRPRSSSNGNFESQWGTYWSSEINTIWDQANYLSVFGGADVYCNFRAYGQSIRCVAE